MCSTPHNLSPIFGLAEPNKSAVVGACTRMQHRRGLAEAQSRRCTQLAVHRPGRSSSVGHQTSGRLLAATKPVQFLTCCTPSRLGAANTGLVARETERGRRCENRASVLRTQCATGDYHLADSGHVIAVHSAEEATARRGMGSRSHGSNQPEPSVVDCRDVVRVVARGLRPAMREGSSIRLVRRWPAPATQNHELLCRG